MDTGERYGRLALYFCRRINRRKLRTSTAEERYSSHIHTHKGPFVMGFLCNSRAQDKQGNNQPLTNWMLFNDTTLRLRENSRTNSSQPNNNMPGILRTAHQHIARIHFVPISASCFFRDWGEWKKNRRCGEKNRYVQFSQIRMMCALCVRV